MTASPFVLMVTLMLGLFAAPLAAEAQQAGKIYRIGFLGTNSPAAIAHFVDAFRQGFRELGYVEGQNGLMEYRFAEGHADRLPALAAELVQLNVDVIIANGNQGTAAVKHATSTISIPTAVLDQLGPQDSDPLGRTAMVSGTTP